MRKDYKKFRLRVRIVFGESTFNRASYITNTFKFADETFTGPAAVSISFIHRECSSRRICCNCCRRNCCMMFQCWSEGFRSISDNHQSPCPLVLEPWQWCSTCSECFYTKKFLLGGSICWHNLSRIRRTGHLIRLADTRWTNAVMDWIRRDVKRTPEHPPAR